MGTLKKSYHTCIVNSLKYSTFNSLDDAVEIIL